MANRNTLFKQLRKEKAADPEINKTGARYSIKIKILMFFTTIAVCALFFTVHFEQKINEAKDYSLVPGYIWPEQTIKAEFTFPVYKPYEQYQLEIREAAQKSPKVFIYDDQALAEAKIKLESITDALPSASPQGNDLQTEIFGEKLLAPLYELTEAEKQAEISNIEREIIRYLNRAYKKGFISVSIDAVETDEIISIAQPNKRAVFKKSNILDANTFLEDAKKKLKIKLPEKFIPIVNEIIPRILVPNLVYDQKLTDKEKDAATKSVPRTEGIVKNGETIVQKGDRVSEDQIKKLQSYRSSAFMKSDRMYSPWIFIGSFGHALLIYSILILYLYFMRKRYFYDNLQLGILSGILIFVAFQSWLSVQVISRFPIEYFILLPALSMLVAIMFDSRTAFYTTVAMTFMLAGIRGNDYETSTAMMIAGMLAAYTVRDIQSRTQMYRSIFFIFIGLLIPIVSFGLERSDESITIVYRMSIGLLNSVFSPLVTFGLLFLLDRASNIATDLRIKEYDNLNHPLIIKMSETAPGTYQHTLSLATMAERCASAIGANPLLAKVGAYFHDIGKMMKPEYFSENQEDIQNKHDKISPKKSAEAIKAHVELGTKLGRQYKLPQRLLDFIPMHHGTTLIKHFYAKAVEESQGQPVDENDFRYPGPKPKTREAVIIMICDTAEALSRLMADDKEGFARAIERIIEERILDGQFDDCDITLKELNIIKETCIKNMAGMAHKRVKYKEIPKQENNDGGAQGKN